MFVKLAALLLALINVSKCSIVVDEYSQDGVYINEYCPKMPYCAEGAHVMCMYYNPNSVMGPKCYGAHNVSVTPDIAAKLLDLFNAVRSKIAKGKEKGKNDEYLPRGYGIYRLEWDNELATFAQVLVNQCVLRHDLCRATKRFPDPGQTAGLVRFSSPDWFPVSKPLFFKTPGLNHDKLMYAAIQATKSWYNQKSSVTSNMIINCPDWTVNPNNQAGKLYMELTHSAATHVGCGMSAYTEYAYYDNHAALNYNSVLVVCNFSSKPRKGEPVYNTTQPTIPGYTVRCGCPPGTDEDEDCLCIKSSNTKVCSENDLSCKDPTVVLLPIFTMEDAPQSKLIQPKYENTSLRINDDSTEIFRQFENSIRASPRKTLIESQNKMNSVSRTGRTYTKKLTTQRKLIPQKKQTKSIQKRYFTKNSLLQKRNLQKPSKIATKYRHKNAISSIFTKVRQFHLPNPNSKSDSTKQNADLQTDENDLNHLDEPRIKKIHPTVHSQTIISEAYDINRPDMLPTASESSLNTVEEKIITNKHYWNKNLLDNVKVTKDEENDKDSKNLLNLLDKLEKEIKTINLKENEKIIIDAKIRKIYGSVVGHQSVISTLDTNTQNFPEVNHKLSINRNNIDDQNEEFDDYDINNYYNRELNGDINLRHVNKYNRYEMDKKNGDDMANLRARRNYPENLNINDHRDSEHLLEDGFNINKKKKRRINRLINRNYDTDSRNKFADNIEELGEANNDVQFNNEKYFKDTSRHHRNIKALNNNILRNKKNRHDNRHFVEDFKLQRSGGVQYSYGNSNDPRKSRRRFRDNDGTGHKRRDRYENTYLDDDEDPLGPERRKYYQNKLEKMQTRIQDSEQYAHNKNRGNRQIRPMLSVDELKIRSKNLDTPYIPERAKFLHGF